MTNLKEEAQNYVAKTTKNITELEKVSVELETKEEEYTDKDGKPFSVKVISVNNEDYRVPITVLMQLKEQIASLPGLKYFRVTSHGTGMNTRYTVIPLGV